MSARMPPVKALLNWSIRSRGIHSMESTGQRGPRCRDAGSGSGKLLHPAWGCLQGLCDGMRETQGRCRDGWRQHSSPLPLDRALISFELQLSSSRLFFSQKKDNTHCQISSLCPGQLW